MLLYATGRRAVEIAHALAVHPPTMSADLHACAPHGVRALAPWGSPGAPGRRSEAQRRAMVRWAAVPPYA